MKRFYVFFFKVQFQSSRRRTKKSNQSIFNKFHSRIYRREKFINFQRKMTKIRQHLSFDVILDLIAYQITLHSRNEKTATGSIRESLIGLQCTCVDYQ